MKAKDQPTSTENAYADALAAELKATIHGEVRFDVGSRALYATDSSNYQQVPIGVVIPKNQEDIKQTVKLCHKYNAPLLSRGGGTSLAGQCCNVAVIMDCSKYYKNILDFDPKNRTITVEPGIVLDDVRAFTSQKSGLTFGPDPATHSHCTIGGMTGNNSCGIHSLLSVNHGLGMRTSDNLEELTILTYDGVEITVGPTSEETLEEIIREGGRKGEIYRKLRDLRDKYAHLIRERFTRIPRRVSGFNLDELLPENGFNVARALAGTESTCVTYLKAKLKLVPHPENPVLVVLGYPDVYSTGDHCEEVLKYKPIACEGLDDMLIGYLERRHLETEYIDLFPEGNGWLLVEFTGASIEEARDTAHKLMYELKSKPDAPSMVLYDKKEQMEPIWKIRESGLGATAFVPGLPDTWPGWEDSAVSAHDIGQYMKDLRQLFHKHGYQAALYGHFGQGVVHCRINFDLVTENGLRNFRGFLNEATDLIVKYNGSLSGEHGDGQSRAELLEKQYGTEILMAFREFKEIWDPDWKMNPGKVVEPYPILSNLRYGIDYAPRKVNTYFKYPEDRFAFSRATMRCVGVGKCRRESEGTMCPSYMVTREEKHATRGRARLLFEMMQDQELKKGWKNEEVKEALDLCLACKGCKGDCPVNVDMATYKAEFFAHYYKGKRRPLYAYLFGYISIWSRIGSKIPWLTNFMLNAPLLGNGIKAIVGVAQKRKMPHYARQTFKEWFFKRGQQNTDKPRVMLWPDTFNNYWHPETAKAAVEILEEFGFQVVVPTQHLCCGRPLYDFGLLDSAKKWLRTILETLRDDIRKDIPIIGLEPSCVSVFRDELGNLFPNDPDANRLKKNVYLLSEFIDTKLKDLELPQLNKKALVHVHCHHKSVLKDTSELNVLRRLGVDFQVLDSGCCGMAGAFGFEKEKYNVSVDAGYRVLIPAVKKASDDTLLITNGFSCRTQIKQLGKRKALHLSELLQMAYRQSPPKTEQKQRGPLKGEREWIKAKTTQKGQSKK